MGEPNRIYEAFNREAVYDLVFGHSTPTAIFRVGRTCQVARRATQEYIYPFEFRVLQARTEMVVSGSSALQFMDRMVYPQSDLDLYVAKDHAAQVCGWLPTEDGRGYRFVPSDRQIERGILTAQLALRSHNTPMEYILSFHSTVVMNVITYRAAYSFYPKGTFEEGLMLPCDTREVNHDSGIEKYKARGWTVTHFAAEPFSDPEEHAFVLGKRWVDDSSSWMILFNDCSRILRHAGIPTKNIERVVDPITLNSFSLVRNRARGLVEMQFSVVKPGFFQNR
ncbi:hypothetical protein EW145_g5587 [Phellinidium pouzarii]|uniref:Uncharacterized protein n=1 Tax=Phellinidium pouzarii TaxID=167371 RepID=A0A4S4KZQ4_9AGAM|nr:hypothetical protein EW145_g5587 [Phellinidium pouzarii]